MHADGVVPSASLLVLVRIYDADGDFLLIEAAQVLPPWVTPDNSENRVSPFSNRAAIQEGTRPTCLTDASSSLSVCLVCRISFPPLACFARSGSPTPTFTSSHSMSPRPSPLDHPFTSAGRSTTMTWTTRQSSRRVPGSRWRKRSPKFEPAGGEIRRLRELSGAG